MASSGRKAPDGRRSPGGARPAGSMTSVQQLEMKRRILLSVQKLSDRDCAHTGVLELREAAKCLDDEQFALMLHTLTEGLDNPHYAKMAFTRRLIIQVVGELGAEHMERLTRRHCSRLCATIFKHVGDADSNVREACADAFASLAQTYSARTVSAAGRGSSPSAGSRLSLFLQCVFDSLSAKAQGKMAQVGTALCLARMIARVGAKNVTPALPRLCQRIEQHLNSKSCAARTELLQALANIAEVSREDLFPHAPFTAVLKCLHSRSFDTRIAAADVLATCAIRLGESMVGLAPMVVQELEGKRFDSVKPVRDAVLEAIDAFVPLMPPPEENTQGVHVADAPYDATAVTATEGSPGSSSRPRQHLSFSPAASDSAGAASGNSDDSENDELGTSRGAQVEGEIREWAAAQDGRSRKKPSKRNRSKRRVPLFAQQPNLNFFQQPNPEVLLEQAQRQHEASTAAVASASPVVPGASVATSAVVSGHHSTSIAHASTSQGSSRVTMPDNRRDDEPHSELQATSSAPAVSDEHLSDTTAEGGARGGYASPQQQSFGIDGQQQFRRAGERESSVGETSPVRVRTGHLSSRSDNSDESRSVRWSTKASPKVGWRPSGEASDGSSRPTDAYASPVATDQHGSGDTGGAGGIFDDSFDASDAAESGLCPNVVAATRRGSGNDRTIITQDNTNASRQQPSTVARPSSYFETELQSDSPLPLRVPGDAQGQVTRLEFNEIAAQLRHISEQQQQLVEIIESSYGRLDDRMGAVEASVQNINSHLRIT